MHFQYCLLREPTQTQAHENVIRPIIKPKHAFRNGKQKTNEKKHKNKGIEAKKT